MGETSKTTPFYDTFEHKSETYNNDEDGRHEMQYRLLIPLNGMCSIDHSHER